MTSAASGGEHPLRLRDRTDLTSTIRAFVTKRLPDWVALYRQCHTHPELSFQEHESAARIAERLRQAGYTVTTGVGRTGVVGVLRNGKGPTVLIRGDMDALPVTEETDLPYQSRVKANTPDGRSVGVMHACGHDIHQTNLIATAETLAALRDRWRGTLVMIAQPAEEIGAGARAMIEDGLFTRFPKPDYCLALHVSAGHPAGVVSYTPGWALANVDSVDITIFGRGGHGSRPHEAVDPVVMAAHVVVALQTIVSRRLDPTEPGVITVGSIHAGSKHNIIPDEARLQITVRSYKDEVRRLLLDGIREVTVHTCRALGAERDPIVHVREEEFTPATYNDPELTAGAVKIFRRLLGPDRVVERPPVMGGEDFGRYPRTLKVPGLIFWLGSVPQDRYENSVKEGKPLPSLHSGKYYPDPEPTLRTGVTCMTSLALALLESVP
ncbi:MAG: amidohydrolase [Planctomycetota bacterium]|nr:MAG: amidohydrolase [Planctomycetota bacterium]